MSVMRKLLAYWLFFELLSLPCVVMMESNVCQMQDFKGAAD